MDVEFRHLRSFVAVAEELSFTRAGARLHLAQPALSAQIRQLEERVGAKLFERTTRRVELTPAGRALLLRAPELLDGMREALAAARMAAAGETGALTVGLLATAALDVTPRILRAFQRERPNVSVSVRNVDFRDPSGGVRSGDADLALVWLPFRDDGLTVHALFDDPRLAVLAADHPLAARDRLRVEDLLAESMCWVQGVDPDAGAFWTLDEQRGGPPRVGATVTGFDDMFAAVRAGLAIVCVPASIATTLPWDDVAVREVAGIPGATVAICHRAGAADPLVHAFAATARAICAD